MCNLGQGIEDNAIRRCTEKFVTNMYKNNFTLEQIAAVAEKTVEEIKVILKI